MTLPRKPPFGLREDRIMVDRRTRMEPMAHGHSHNQIELNFIATGAAHYLFGGRRIRVAAGDLVFFWGAVPHRATDIEGEARFTAIYIPLERVMSFPISGTLKTALLKGAVLRANSTQQGDAELFRQIARDIEDEGSDLRELAVAQLELRLRRADLEGVTDLLGGGGAGDTEGQGRDATNTKVIEMVRLISEGAALGVTVEDVARNVDLHPKYAMTLFRRSLGMTMTQYLTRRRLVIAQGLLLDRSLSTATVAYESGFGSVSRFYEAFRSNVGVTPRVFRSMYRG